MIRASWTSSGRCTSPPAALATSGARWRLHVLRAERDALFAEIDANMCKEEAQAHDITSSVSVALPARFALGRNDHEAGPSMSDAVHTTDSGDEE